MKKLNRIWLAGGLVAALFLASPLSSLQAHCGHCGVGGDKPHAHAKADKKADKKEACAIKGCGGLSCPKNIEGAKTEVEKTKDGVIIKITSTDKDVVKQIQAAVKKEKCDACKNKSKK